jgi:hypothetical protein
MLKISRYSFAALIFAFQGALLSTVIFFSLVVMLSLFDPSQKLDWAPALVISFYVLAATFLSGWVAFVIAIIARNILRLNMGRLEPYLIIAIAVVLANLCAAALIGFQWSSLNFVVYFTSIICLIVGPKIYASVWKKLTSLLAEPPALTS